MRLTNHEKSVIKTIILSYDNQARVLLFGSRTDSHKRGGDIDLLVITDNLVFSDKLNILADLHQYLGDQKIDLLLDDGNGTFAQSILHEAIEL